MSGESWWIVVLPGEDISRSEMYGPFRSKDAAQRVADKWNSSAAIDDQAELMPLLPPGKIANATRLRS